MRPGSELHRLLGKIGLRAGGGCNCAKHIRTMDRKGCMWCENNINTIVEWLHKAAKKRRLPFSAVVVRALVRKAIANARKSGKCVSESQADKLRKKKG